MEISLAKKAKQGKYQCSVDVTVALIGGKWKPTILFHLLKEKKRFGELKRLVVGVTERVLTMQLRELEEDQLITRKAYPEIPPRVEYQLSKQGQSLVDILEQMAQWGENYMRMQDTKLKNSLTK